MGKFFDQFPLIIYDIEGNAISKFETVTNIFFRLQVVQEALNNISAYYYHSISESETPEIIAEAVYGDPEAHWIVLLANNIVDPQYDWPLTSNAFYSYMIDKYGSIANAQLQIHHYEKVIRREFGDTTTDNAMDVPYDYYEGSGSLPETQSVQVVDLGNGQTVVEVINREAITYYDYENQLNENKRLIKIIKPEYYPLIIREFNEFTGNKRSPYLRKLS
jgi:Base plate wedge protein 53